MTDVVKHEAKGETLVKYENEEDETPIEKDKFGIVVRGKGGDGVDRVINGKRGGRFEHLDGPEDAEPGQPARSVDGWVLFLSNLPRETSEEDVQDLFVGYADLKVVKFPLDARECRCLGHAMIEIQSYDQCIAAIKAIDGQPYGPAGNRLSLSFAFVNPPAGKKEEDASPNRKREHE